MDVPTMGLGKGELLSSQRLVQRLLRYISSFVAQRSLRKAVAQCRCTGFSLYTDKLTSRLPQVLWCQYCL